MQPGEIPRKLNFGCGYDKREGFYNVDSDPQCQPDLLLIDNDLSAIPRDYFDEIVARDVLEHIPRTMSLAVILEWVDMLTMGGQLHVQTSSIEGVAERLAALPTYADQHGWTQCLFGTQAHPGDYHFTGFTDRTLQVHLLAAGLQVNGIWVEDHWLLVSQTTKISSWADALIDTDDMTIDAFVDHIFHVAFNRDPDTYGGEHMRIELGAGRLTRRDALKQLMSSPERLFRTATAHGL